MQRRISARFSKVALVGALISSSSALGFDNPFENGYRPQQYQQYPYDRGSNQGGQQNYGSPSSRPQSNGQQQYSYAAPQNGYQQQGYGSQSGFPDGSSYPTLGGYPRARVEDGDRPQRRHRHRRPVRDSDDDSDQQPRVRARQAYRHAPSNANTDDDGGQQLRVRIRRAPQTPRTAASSYPTGDQAAYGFAVPAGQTVACVRTCDGYFFPLGQASDMNALNAQASLCTALCPDTQAEVFLIPPGADGIQTATSLAGKPYSKMPNANRYTKEFSRACTCHGEGAGQVLMVSSLKDFTLRRGDAVMTTSGLLVFKGAWKLPYVMADFLLLDKAKSYLSNAVAFAAMENATKWLQDRLPHAKSHDDTAVEVGSYVTDSAGKTVRLIGDALSPPGVEAGEAAANVDSDGEPADPPTGKLGNLSSIAPPTNDTKSPGTQRP